MFFLCRLIRDISRCHKGAVAILGDLQGPKLRTGTMQGEGLQLVAGSVVTLTTRDVPGADGLILTTYKDLPRDVEVGNRILLIDSLMELIVLSVAGSEVKCRGISGGLVKER